MVAEAARPALGQHIKLLTDEMRQIEQTHQLPEDWWERDVLQAALTKLERAQLQVHSLQLTLASQLSL